MKFLLPHRFKKIGLTLAPSGFLLWLAMQRGYITRLCTEFFGQDNPVPHFGQYHHINVASATIGFFSFLVGLYFIAFSKEKIEDEMVQRTRMDSFQIAALLQLVIIIIGFTTLLYSNLEEEITMLLIFIVATITFWISFVVRFNYLLHYRII